MAGRRVHGASNMAVFLHNQGISAVGIESLLSSGSSPNQIHGVRSIINAGDTYEHLLGRSYYRPLCLKRISDENLDERFHHPEKKRRLTVDQIEFLEKSFELDNKLEPDRKIQLARDLGIQPRQVAIWFQNRRARCKTKQLEMDFEVLKSSYDVLKAKHDNLLKEKEKLNAKVLCLTEKLNLKGKDRLNSGSFALSKPTCQVQNQDPKSFSEAKKTDTTVVECNHEERSTADGAAFDSNICNDGAGLYVNAFEPVHCDLTHLEENEVGGCNYLKLEDNSYEFLEEDQGLWFWP